MLNSIIRAPALFIAVPLITLIAASHQAHAEIYKWRDNRGVIQYSDSPPVSNYTKVTRNEMVNALQTKDLCTVGPIKKSVASTKNLGAFLFVGTGINKSTTSTGSIWNTATAGTTVSKQVAPTSSVSQPIAKSTSVASPVTNQYTPLSTKSIFSVGGSNVSVLGLSSSKASKPRSNPIAAPATPVKTPTVAPTPTVPAVTAPSLPPVTTAPPVQTSAPPPTQVATTNPTTAPTTSDASANLIQVGLMPAVDISKNMTHAIGSSILKINSTTEVTPDSHTGAFRISCAPSHMSNDDPIVYPNQQGAAHHHTFYGNVSLDYKSNLSNLSAIGNSTCAGGIMNRSAYWMPSMIDTSTNTPILPTSTIFYYKSTVDVSLVKAPPKGLRMITGNSKAKSAAELTSNYYICYPGPNSKRTVYGWNPMIPKGSECEVGDTLTIEIAFPQCWDGVNLDSPSHQDHVVFPTHRPVAPPNNWFCPATHPVVIPQISMVTNFTVTKAAQDGNWRLASDNYERASDGGYSIHADWVNGWDEATMAGIVKNCLNARKDAHAHLLCDGRMFYN